MLPEVTAWRRQQRARLLRARFALSKVERAALARPMLARLSLELQRRPIRVLGIYWPIQREVDIRPLSDALGAGRSLQLALPVVVEKGAPLEYWRWRVGEPTAPGFWNIPVPRERVPVKPDAVIAPLVGFHGRYRLGYGGGYFDRTLAAMRPRPFAIGLGFAWSRLEAFSPEPHDVPMDVIITDTDPEERPLRANIEARRSSAAYHGEAHGPV